MKTRAAASRLTPRDLAKNSRMVFDDFALPSWRGRSSTPATKMTPMIAAISHRAGLNPITSSSRPPTKKPMPFMAFFEPVKYATHLKSWPAPSADVALMADLDAVFVKSLASPAMPCAATTQATDAATVQAGSSIESITSPAICNPCPTASMRGIPKRVANHPPPRLATMPANSYSRNRNASVNGE